MENKSKRTVRLRLKWEPRDLWVGLFWDTRMWFGGFSDALTASASNAPPAMAANRAVYQHQEWHGYLCLVPLLPLHLSVVRCPRPDECRSLKCPVGRSKQQADEPVTAVLTTR